MKTFLIIYSSTNNITELQARIRSLGNAFFFMDTHCLLSVQDNAMTAKQVYERIEGDSQLNSIFVNAINTSVDIGYWGSMSRDFWDWLKDHPSCL